MHIARGKGVTNHTGKKTGAGNSFMLLREQSQCEINFDPDLLFSHNISLKLIWVLVSTQCIILTSSCIWCGSRPRALRLTTNGGFWKGALLAPGLVNIWHHHPARLTHLYVDQKTFWGKQARIFFLEHRKSPPSINPSHPTTSTTNFAENTSWNL